MTRDETIIFLSVYFMWVFLALTLHTCVLDNNFEAKYERCSCFSPCAMFPYNSYTPIFNTFLAEERISVKNLRITFKRNAISLKLCKFLFKLRSIHEALADFFINLNANMLYSCD